MAMNEHDMLSDAELETLFESARETAPMPSQRLWEQVHHDALAAQPAPGGIPTAIAPRTGVLAGFLEAIGGWPSLVGLTVAPVLGLWIGFASPDALRQSTIGALLPGFSASETFDLEDLTPGFGGLNAIYEEG